MAVDGLVSVLTSLGLSRAEAVTVWQPLILYIIGMAVYAIFVFELYHFISRKNIFELDLREYARGREKVKNIMKTVLHFAKYLVVFPVFPILWFTIFTVLISILSGGRSVESLFVVSMAVVSTIRIGAYYDERLAEDLGKMLPLAMLGIFVVDGIQALSVERIFDIVEAVALEWRRILYYWGFTVALELVLRIADSLKRGEIETEPGENEKAEKELEDSEEG